MFSKKTL